MIPYKLTALATPPPAPATAPRPVAAASLPTRAALGEPHYLAGAVFLPVVTVLDVRGGGV